MVSGFLFQGGSWPETEGEVGRGFCANVKLGVVSIWMKAEIMAVDDFTQREHVGVGQKGAKHWALGGSCG